MKLRIVGAAVSVCMLFAISQGINAQESIIWKDLKPGLYAVGFTVLHEYDYSRTFKPKYDYEGNIIYRENARPVQILVWYPAEHVDHKQHMSHGLYIAARESAFDYSLKNKTDRSDYISKQMTIQRQRGADSTKIEALYSRESFALMDAPVRDGKFPLIIYSPGLNGLSCQNYPMFEYLASHGYIVASSASFGQFGEAMTPDLEGIEAQVRDIEFIFEEMRNFPSADIFHVGAMGMSWGGLSNVVFALRNLNVDAVSCLEGSILYGSGPKMIKGYLNYNPKNMRAVFLYFGRDEHQNEYGYDMYFYDESIYADAYFLMFNNLLHRHFDCTQLLRYDHAGSDVADEYLEHIDKSYETMCLYNLNFYNCYLKHEKDGFEFINRSPEENGIPAAIVNMKSRKGYKAPPTEEQFFQIINDQGLKRAIEIYRAAQSIDSAVVVFSEYGLNSAGYKFLTQGKLQEAIEVFRLNVETFPASSNTYDSLGEAYMRNGNIELAIENYTKSLELNPENSNAERMLLKLTNK